MNIARSISALAFFCLIAAPFAPASAQEKPRSTLTVTGEGSAAARPDLAVISLGVVTQAPRAQDALTQNSKAMAEVIAAAKDAGIAPRDLQTSRVSIRPTYSQPAPGSREAPRIAGYEASNSLSIRVRELDRLGGLLDRVVVTGANQIRSVDLVVAEPGPHRDAARTAAVKDAQRKAGLYADAAGVRIVRIVSIEEGGQEPARPVARMSAAAGPARPDVPVEAGEQEFRASVTAVFEIEGK